MPTLFDRESAFYDGAYDSRRGHAVRARLQATLDLIGSGPGEVLDAGMGPGRLCAELERRGWMASGIDVSAAMVAIAAERLPLARKRLLAGNITDIPFPAESFDAVAATGVIEYVDQPAEAISELSRVLRPGGTLVVSVPNARALPVVWRRSVWYPAMRVIKRTVPLFRRPPPHRKPPPVTVDRLRAVLEAAGLRPVAIRHVSYVAAPGPLGSRRPALRLAEQLERRQPRAARALATQVVVAARKEYERMDTR